MKSTPLTPTNTSIEESEITCVLGCIDEFDDEKELLEHLNQHQRDLIDYYWDYETVDSEIVKLTKQLLNGARGEKQ